MQRRHFEAVAKAIKTCNITDNARASVVLALSNQFKQENPRFQPVRFMLACGCPHADVELMLRA